MEMPSLVSKSLEILRSRPVDNMIPKEVLDNISYVSWLPYLGIQTPHALAGYDTDEIKEAKEIYDYFSDQYKEDSFNRFIKYMSGLSPIPEDGLSKSKQMLKYIKMIELSKLHKSEHDKLESRLTGIPR